ncbi:MAG: LacI family DNA-binding transcriptional regulator [Pirellulales bacterium]|nr:LacI family DNA-binding transcriptional regulator [Pirellulales bacterium]
MAATIYDIAKQAGVSSSTVARVLRGDTKGGRRDSAERAARIREIANRLGYRPNLRARAFSEQRTKGVGLLYTDDAWVFEGVNDKVLQGLVRELRKFDHHLLLVPIDDGGDWEELVLGGHIDGSVTFQFLPACVRTTIREAQMPCVLLGDNSDPELAHIVVDDAAGAYSAARHLIALGHRRIGLYVHDTVKPHCSIRDRRDGFEAAMREHALTPCFWHCSDGEMVSTLVRGDDRPTGLICYSDLESTLIMHAMWQHGVKIPADLSLIGFNDKFATKHMTPHLTTVAFDANRIGSLGAQMIIESIDGQERHDQQRHGVGQQGPASAEKRAVKVSTQLIIRGSTAPPS